MDRAWYDTGMVSPCPHGVMRTGGLYTVDTRESTAWGGLSDAMGDVSSAPLPARYHTGSSTNNAPLISSASFFLVLHSSQGSSSVYLGVRLPVVLGGAVSSSLGVLRGIIDGLHDSLVLGIEGDGLDDVVHLVPQLGGREVVVGGNW